MSDKMREDAIREAARNAAVDEYFKARPQLMWSRHEECLVEAGFDRGWQAAQSERKDKPTECVNGCPDKQVCDYCQGAAAIMPCGASVTNVYEAYDTGKKAAQSVPVVNQCDGCCRGLTVDDGIHRSENGLPVMVCERPVYDAAELDRLQEGEACAEVVLEAALVQFSGSPTEFECIGKMAAEVVRRYDAELERLRKDAERYRWLSYNASYSIHEMLFGKPAFIATHKESDLAECIDAAIAAEGEKE